MKAHALVDERKPKTKQFGKRIIKVTLYAVLSVFESALVEDIQTGSEKCGCWCGARFESGNEVGNQVKVKVWEKLKEVVE